tara:strand:- start:356 stop:1303 length:948 start_codon:yes stop_codon:yes gene_type:complete
MGIYPQAPQNVGFNQKQRKKTMADLKMEKQGIDAVGAAVNVEVPFKFASSSLTASCQKIVAEARKHAQKDQDNEDYDVRGFALVSEKVIKELAQAGKIIILDSVRAAIYNAAGYETKSSDPEYNKMKNRSKRGIQAAMMAYNSPAHQLDAIGNLEAHTNVLKSTFVFKDDDKNVIDRKCPNTLEFNDKAEDFIFVGQSAYDSQMAKLGLAEKKKGPDSRETDKSPTTRKLSTAEKTLHGISALETLTAFLGGKTTAKGSSPSLETLSHNQFELLEQALNVSDAVRRTFGLKADVALRELVAEKRPDETLPEVKAG